MATITWEIAQLSCYPAKEDQTDVVFSVSWRVNGSDGTYNATAYGTQDLALYTEGAPFTPYANLTQAQVIGWVQDAMGQVQVAKINASIESQIANQANPPITTPVLPWVA